MRPFIFSLAFLLSGFVAAQNEGIRYSFFAAGHTYGNPNNIQFGLHPPFVEKIPYLNDYPTMELGFLTGDVVPWSSSDCWDSAQVDIDSLHMPIYIAAGNHDMGDEFLLRFGTYYSYLKHDSDLFIILTPGLDNWNISGDQKEFLVSTLDSFAFQSRNVFIILHELIWWSPDSIFKNVAINYIGHYPGSTNFWNEIEPILHALPNNVVMYAGDLGCTDLVSPYMYYKFDNITLIASGMGGGVRDNIIITDVYSDTLTYDLYALNGDDPDKLGELTDFSLFPASVVDHLQNEIQLFPNPCHDELFIKWNPDKPVEFEVTDLQGKVLIRKKINSSEFFLETENYPPGLYFIRLMDHEYVTVSKFIKS